jgi:hypothetical protein
MALNTKFPTHPKPPGKPKLGPLIPVIEAILAADVTAPPKPHEISKIRESTSACAGKSSGMDGIVMYRW